MCGIFSILNNSLDETNIIKNFVKGENRGPENSNIKFLQNGKLVMGFHRLAINGLEKEANQPMEIDDYMIICNGEIYNFKYLHELLNIDNKTGSDCEIIIHLYKQFGIKQTLQMIDGVFAFILFDKKKQRIFVARDLFGVRPLFRTEDKGIHGFASEIKMLCDINAPLLKPFPPGTFSSFVYSNHRWCYKVVEERFATLNAPVNPLIDTLPKAYQLVQDALVQAVKKRVFSTDRKYACLLSGGLDSSLITAIVNTFCTKEKLETYSIGLQGSEDIKYARKVADFLGTKHTEIICTEQEFLAAIPEVIQQIESYDTTTVRASVGNYLVSKYISEHSEAKVIFNGDGSDEVCGGYMYFHLAPNAAAFDHECRRLLNDIHLFDVLRSDRSISSNGLEARTPFLDRYFVQTFLSIPPHLRFEKNRCEKYILRKAFEPLNLLPKEVLFRTKEAFSDGVSPQNRSWFEIIQEHIEGLGKFSLSGLALFNNPPKTKEQIYYRHIFEKHYKSYSNVIPYFWMPKFIEATDSSARTLKIYKNKI